VCLVAVLACVHVDSSDRQSPHDGAAQLGVRNGHAMTYDTDRGRVILYGGADASSVTGDTWEWNSYRRSWQRLSVEGPGPRTFPAFAYHERARHAVLFGGNRVLFGKPDDTNTFLSDTWIWRRGRWSRIDVSGPGPRAEAAVAYDQHRARVVLFGGYYRGPSGTVRLGDTWEWDGTRWIQMAGDGPSPRNGAAMAYDARRQRVVLFGGSGASRETWEWDGSRWLQRDAGEVEGRFNPAMIFDRARGLVVRFGGWTGKTRVDDTWTLGSGHWSRLEVIGPPARNHASFTYDNRRRRAVLYGGHDGENVFGDTWEWDGEGWHPMALRPPERRVENGH
jgi:hypothetical protein